MTRRKPKFKVGQVVAHTFPNNVWYVKLTKVDYDYPCVGRVMCYFEHNGVEMACGARDGIRLLTRRETGR